MSFSRLNLHLSHLLSLTLILLICGCRLPQSKKDFFLFSPLVSAQHETQTAATLFAELGNEEAFIQLTRYLYRWYLDEGDFKRSHQPIKHQLWLREVKVVADPEDKSRFLEVYFPVIGVLITLKKTDYQIPELKMTVKSEGYRITQLCRETCKQQINQQDYAVMDVNIEALYERLFETRHDRNYPNTALCAHLKKAAVDQINALEPIPALINVDQQTPNTFFIAPIQNIANEVWVFWEEGKLLFRFTSDIDMSKPELLQSDNIRVQIYNALEQTIVSHEERPCDNRFSTRDQIGRALYNCVILGQKLTAQDKQP